MRRVINALFQKLGANNKDERKRLSLQFIKFGLVGLSNTLVSWACYYLFLWIDDDLYMVGSIVGGVVSIANAFFWNNRFVFKAENHDWKSVMKRLAKTYVCYGGTSLLGVGLLWLEVNLLGISKTWAPIVNLIITIPLNFLINKFWTFRTGDNK